MLQLGNRSAGPSPDTVPSGLRKNDGTGRGAKRRGTARVGSSVLHMYRGTMGTEVACMVRNPRSRWAPAATKATPSTFADEVGSPIRAIFEQEEVTPVAPLR